MSQVWVTSTDGYLLRADQIWQLTTFDGSRVVLVGGSRFIDRAGPPRSGAAGGEHR
jgi:hypothetical protein